MGEKLTPVSRTSFALTDRNAFDTALAASLDWLQQTSGSALPKQANAGQGFEFSEGNSAATISASRLDDAQGNIWAARIDFTGDRTAERHWVTDLFVESRQGDVTRFGAQLVCRHDENDPRFEHSRPRIIKDIIETLSAEADGEQLHNSFSDVNEGDVEELVQLIQKPDRRLPIVLFSADNDGGTQIDIDRLARRISGTAHLRVIRTEPSFELSRLVGKKMSTFGGAARIYLPGIELANEDHLRHPIWFAPQSGWNPKAAHQIASRVLPLGFRDSDGGTRFWRLGLLRQATSRADADAVKTGGIAKQNAEIAALKLEVENAREEALTAESLMNEEVVRVEEVEAEQARLEQDNYSLRQRIRGLEAGSAEAQLSLSAEDVYSLSEGSPSLECSLNIISSVFPTRITVLKSAVESARDSIVFKYQKRAFDLLWSLSTAYYDALSNGESDNTARTCFGAGYSAKEKDTLSKSGRERRTFIYAGNQVEMMRHLKIGVAENKAETLRVHFEWIADEGKIVIGHCGAHLDF